MRPIQNNPKRARGRGRKPHGSVGGGGPGNGGGRIGGGANPNRTLDSNGPDIKIRGTVSHIYEKYQTLARDAISSGDYVGAENYLQHAEHYFRVLAASAPVQTTRDSQHMDGVNGARHPDAPQPASQEEQNNEAAPQQRGKGDTGAPHHADHDKGELTSA